MDLNNGYATKISEHGGNLSGGQGRELLSHEQYCPILASHMDEATNALDYNTEKQLCLNLQEWSAGRTVLFITHRLSTIKNSDQIL